MLVFVLRELDPPLPPRKGGYRVGAQTTENTCKAIMTDSPIDDTEAREQDAPGTTDAKHRAPVHGHTGDVPFDKALSDIAIAAGADNRPTGPAGYDDPSRWDDPNVAARCQTQADLNWRRQSRPSRSPSVPAGAKGLLLQAPEGRVAATTSGVSCRAGRVSTAAW
eukprot:scaffold10295_cov116-Isochrysis_galbana.AAC.7